MIVFFKRAYAESDSSIHITLFKYLVFAVDNNQQKIRVFRFAFDDIRINFLIQIKKQKQMQENREKTFSFQSPITQANSVEGSCSSIRLDNSLFSQFQNSFFEQINKPRLIKHHSNGINQFMIDENEQDPTDKVMQWFETKGIYAGCPEDIQKQYNSKLHKKVMSMIIGKYEQKKSTSQSLSLSQRRLKSSLSLSM